MPFPAMLVGFFVWLWTLQSNTVWSAAHAAASPWRDTGLDTGFVEKRLDDRHCGQSSRAFLSCVGAVQGILDLHGRDLHLVPMSELAESRTVSGIQVRFGSAAVVKDERLRVSAAGNALQVLRTRKHHILRWRDWLRPDRRREVRFTAMRIWLQDAIIDPAREEDFAAAAINGYLAVADAHARIAPAGNPRGSSAGQPGANAGGGNDGLVYIGIGAGVQPLMDAALVTSVVREGPASDAGLRTQDFILAVDGEAVAGLSAEALVEKLRGERGTQVAVTVKRQDQVRELLIQRDLVRVKNVVAYGFIDRGWQFVYLRIDSFLPGNTCVEVRRALVRELKPTLNGLILDLRANTGGRIDQAVCVADLFLPQDEIVLEIRDVRGKDKAEQVRTRRDAKVRVPMVTLVNASTGSASEVLAGALQDHGRSLVVGELTFGKGTVQTARPWRGSRSVLEFLTVARYYRPSGVGVQLIGIEPDIPVAAPPGKGRAGRVVLREADLFPTALERERQFWEHPNPESVATLRECTTSQGLAAHRLRDEAEVGRITDYPLAVGQDALVCRLTRRL